MSTANLRRIECARRRCALADDLILRGVDGKVRIRPIALAFLACGSLGAREPPKAEAKHDDRGDDAKTWRRERSGTEKRHRIAFWIAGVPGSADIVKVDVPSAIAAGIKRFGIAAARNSACAIGANTKNATKRLTPP